MTLVSVLGVLFLYMCGLFVLSVRSKNNGVADVGYGIGFLTVVTTSAVLSPDMGIVEWALILLVLAWSLRLATRIYRKNKGKPEDFRYRAWREAWGRSFLVRSFFQVYMLQGCVIALIASPIVLTLLERSEGNGILAALGLTISVIGLVFEAISDAQLDRFLHTEGRTERIMKSGLWRYSRHPNYFGESLVWIGVGIATITFHSYPVMSALSPFLILFLLLKVSGVPMLEKKWTGDPEWEDYKAKTSVFIPFPPHT
jgi:steroid 5-alpha reductase family enzyme